MAASVLVSILFVCCVVGTAPGSTAQPISGFDYDPSANILYTNSAFVVVNHITTNASVVVRTLHTLLLGNKDAPEDSTVGGNFTLESGASLFIDTVRLHLGGRFFQVDSGLLADQCTLIALSRNATITGDISNGALCLNASNVSTCVVVETNNATIAFYQGFVPMMTNVSCVTSFFAQVNVTSGTGSTGTGTGTFVWPDASSCKSPSVIAAAVIMACPDEPPSTTTTEPNYPVIIGVVPGTNYPIINISGTDTNSSRASLVEDPPLISAYWTVILIVAGCMFFVVLLVVILVVIVMKTPALRVRFMPFRDRTRFVSTMNPPETRDTSPYLFPSAASYPRWRQEQYKSANSS